MGNEQCAFESTNTSDSVLLMGSYFDFIYAKALYEVKAATIERSCYGCEINHPSQNDCLINDGRNRNDVDEYKLDIYFDDRSNEKDGSNHYSVRKSTLSTS